MDSGVGYQPHSVVVFSCLASIFRKQHPNSPLQNHSCPLIPYSVSRWVPCNSGAWPTITSHLPLTVMGLDFRVGSNGVKPEILVVVTGKRQAPFLLGCLEDWVKACTAQSLCQHKGEENEIICFPTLHHTYLISQFSVRVFMCDVGFCYL